MKNDSSSSESYSLMNGPLDDAIDKIWFGLVVQFLILVAKIRNKSKKYFFIL